MSYSNFVSGGAGDEHFVDYSGGPSIGLLFSCDFNQVMCYSYEKRKPGK